METAQEATIPHDKFIKKLLPIISGWLVAGLKTTGTRQELMVQSNEIINKRITHIIGRWNEIGLKQ